MRLTAIKRNSCVYLPECFLLCCGKCTLVKKKKKKPGQLKGGFDTNREEGAIQMMIHSHPIPVTPEIMIMRDGGEENNVHCPDYIRSSSITIPLCQDTIISS